MSLSPPSTPNSPSVPGHGVFRNGQWFCNCDPRLEAEVRTVRRNTQNYGKRFYVCSKKPGQGNRCDMFLFVDEAKKREREHLMSNGRSEKRQTTILESITPSKGKQKAGPTTVVIIDDSPQAVANEASTSKSATASTSKMAVTPRSPKRPSATAETSTLRNGIEDTYYQAGDFYDTTSDEDEEEEEIRNHIMSRIRTTNNVPPRATPTAQPAREKRKYPFEDDLLEELSSGGEEELIALSAKTTSTLGKHRDAFVTPSALRTTDVEHGLPTPSLTKGKSTKKVLFADAEASKSSAPDPKRQRLDDGTRLFGTDATIQSASASPRPSSSSPAPTTTTTTSSDVTSEVMELLRDENVTAATRDGIRRALDKYAGLAKGWERGRDASRKAAKEAEDRVARLQARVDDLERSRQELRSQLMDMWNSV